MNELMTLSNGTVSRNDAQVLARNGAWARTAFSIMSAFAALFSCSCSFDSHKYGGPLSISGRIEADETRLGVVFPAKVQAVGAREGQSVKKGQELLRLDDSPLRTQLQWVDRLIAKGEMEKKGIERLLLNEKEALKKAQAMKLTIAVSPGVSTFRSRLAMASATTANATKAVTTPALKGTDETESLDNGMSAKLSELDREQMMKLKTLQDARRLAEEHLDTEFANQQNVLAQARRKEKQSLSRLNVFPIHLKAKVMETAADDVFDAKEKALEEIYQSQRNALAETATMSVTALTEGFAARKAAIEDLYQAKLLIAAQFQNEKRNLEQLLQQKRAELSDGLARLHDPKASQRLLRDLRSQQLASQSAMLSLSIEQFKARLSMIDTELTKAKATKEELATKIAACKLTSPVDGICIARNVQPGELVVPGPTLLKLADLDTPYVRAYVAEGDISKVKIGQNAHVFIDSATQKPLTATVAAVDSEATFTPENVFLKDDRVRQAFGVKLTLTNSDGSAKPGMPADVTILTDTQGLKANAGHV